MHYQTLARMRHDSSLKMRASSWADWSNYYLVFSGQVMMDPYCPVMTHTRLPDNANLVAPKGGAAGSMPINTPQVPLSNLSFLLDDFSFQVRRHRLPPTQQLTPALAESCAPSKVCMAYCAVLPLFCGTSVMEIYRIGYTDPLAGATELSYCWLAWKASAQQLACTRVATRRKVCSRQSAHAVSAATV